MNLNKRANIALFKKVNINENGQTIEKWVEFGRPDLDQNCKYQRVQTIAFRVWFTVEV